MKIPVIPILVVLIFGTAAIYLYNSGGSTARVLDAPRVNQLVDIEGVESEVAIAPDGVHYAVISAGDVWLLDTSQNTQIRVTQTPENESFPAWSPDGRRVTFTRGADTWILTADSPNSQELFKSDATSLDWSPTGRMAFVRGRGLWLTEPNGSGEHQVVEPSANSEMTIQAPRFSPDSTQLAFLKTVPGIRGEVWLLNLANGVSNPLIADRQIENPFDVGWLNEGRDLAYLTDRSGSYAIWIVNLTENVLTPLTPPLFSIPLQRVGMGVWRDRIALPRHFLDSDIVWSDGTPVAQSDDAEFEPALSPNGETVAYTIAKENKFEIWTVSANGDTPAFRTLGREPRFSPNGFQIVYTHTDLLGNPDLWDPLESTCRHASLSIL